MDFWLSLLRDCRLRANSLTDRNSGQQVGPLENQSYSKHSWAWYEQVAGQSEGSSTRILSHFQLQHRDRLLDLECPPGLVCPL